MAGAMAVTILHQIRCDGVEPCRKLLVRVKLRAVLINADESFPRGLGGIFLVSQTADEVVEQLARVPLHEFVQRRTVTRREANHVRTVAVVGLCGLVAHCFTFTEKLVLPSPCGPA